MRDDASTPKSRFFLAQTLVRRPGGVTLRALTERLGVCERTALRYLRELPLAGTPIHVTRQGDRKVYAVPQAARSATIAMTELEMVGVTVARELGSYLRGTPMAQGLDQVFEKVEAALKQKDLGAHLRRKIFDVNEGAMIFRPRDRENLSAFVDALLRGHQVRVCHERVSSGRVPFLVDPYSLLLHRKGPYLMGKSHHPPHKGASPSTGSARSPGRRARRSGTPPATAPPASSGAPSASSAAPLPSSASASTPASSAP